MVSGLWLITICFGCFAGLSLGSATYDLFGFSYIPLPVFRLLRMTSINDGENLVQRWNKLQAKKLYNDMVLKRGDDIVQVDDVYQVKLMCEALLKNQVHLNVERGSNTTFVQLVWYRRRRPAWTSRCPLAPPF